MGEVIDINNLDGDFPSVLTETGSGSLLSSGSLSERPAVAYLDEAESPVYVVTNRKLGVDPSDSNARVTPGRGYRTVCVVTDRRILVVVGNPEAAPGDWSRAISLADVQDVSRTDSRLSGALSVTLADESGLEVAGPRTGLDAVESYLEEASLAWTRIERVRARVDTAVTESDMLCDSGEYDRAVGTLRDAKTDLDGVEQSLQSLEDRWPAASVTTALEGARTDYRDALERVELRAARAHATTAESRWRSGEYEAAHDAYDAALEWYRGLPADGDGGVVQAERDRVERRRDDLAVTPIHLARASERAAERAETPESEAAWWTAALERYRTVLELDWGGDPGRFAGDRDAIRDRLTDVVSRLVTARRAAAEDERRAGEWYVGAEQYDVAIEAFESALAEYDRALEVARQCYPDAVEHLEADREAIDAALSRARAAKNGETVPPVTPEESSSPDGEHSVTIGDGRGEFRAEAVASDPNEPTEGDGGEGPPDLEDLSRDAFVDVVSAVLSEIGWATTERATTHDVVATKSDPVTERMPVRVVHDPDGDGPDASDVDRCASVEAAESECDAVMLATSGTLTPDLTRRARRHRVRLLDGESIAAVLEERDLHDVLPTADAGLGGSA